VLLILDHQPVLVRLVELTLNHGVYAFRNATTRAEAEAALATWQPHLVLIDMELAEASLIEQMGGHGPGSARLPVIGLTRRGDLKSKLAAFEAGVDDILTVPFAPEELLARVIALVRRAYNDAVTFTPLIKVGELEIDILKRIAQLPAGRGHRRNPAWRRKAKQSEASPPMRSRPASAMLATSSTVSEHRLASSADLSLPHTCSIGLRSGA
jgi:DNA-binding response OmpR family regulator